eukprot:7382366-Prymnesium_polylepis.5
MAGCHMHIRRHRATFWDVEGELGHRRFDATFQPAWTCVKLDGALCLSKSVAVACSPESLEEFDAEETRSLVIARRAPANDPRHASPLTHGATKPLG